MPRISCPANVYRFSKDLVRKIDMVPFGEPQIHRFGTGNKAGITLVQLIETSNITAHLCDETGDGYIDVFSCKDYDARVVEQLVREYFEPKHLDSTTIMRQARESHKYD